MSTPASQPAGATAPGPVNGAAHPSPRPAPRLGERRAWLALGSLALVLLLLGSLFVTRAHRAGTRRHLEEKARLAWVALRAELDKVQTADQQALRAQLAQLPPFRLYQASGGDGQPALYAGAAAVGQAAPVTGDPIFASALVARAQEGSGLVSVEASAFGPAMAYALPAPDRQRVFLYVAPLKGRHDIVERVAKEVFGPQEAGLVALCDQGAVLATTLVGRDGRRALDADSDDCVGRALGRGVLGGLVALEVGGQTWLGLADALRAASDERVQAALLVAVPAAAERVAGLHALLWYWLAGLAASGLAALWLWRAGRAPASPAAGA